MIMEEIKGYISEKLLDIRDRVKNIHLTYIYEKSWIIIQSLLNRQKYLKQTLYFIDSKKS